jgi:hypothetical protein
MFVHHAYSSKKVKGRCNTVSLGTDQEGVVHSHNGILCSLKKEEDMTPAATALVNLEDVRMSTVASHEKRRTMSLCM